MGTTTDITKWSGKMHVATMAVATLGALSLLGAWFVGDTGRILGLDREHLYLNAGVLMLLAIAFGVGTIIHLLEERKGP